jgi:hypothetical protein
MTNQLWLKILLFVLLRQVETMAVDYRFSFSYVSHFGLEYDDKYKDANDSSISTCRICNDRSTGILQLEWEYCGCKIGNLE